MLYDTSVYPPVGVFFSKLELHSFKFIAPKSKIFRTQVANLRENRVAHGLRCRRRYQKYIKVNVNAG